MISTENIDWAALIPRLKQVFHKRSKGSERLADCLLSIIRS